MATEYNKALSEALSSMIISHSGWRGVFALTGGEEGRASEISEAHKLIAAGAAAVFAEYLRTLDATHPKAAHPLILVGADTRPTGPAIAAAIIAALLADGCTVRYAGAAAAPEIMAWARSFSGKTANGQSKGFIYISASHNPIGHNGLKFGLTDGGVLSAQEAAKLAENFRAFMGDSSNLARLEQIVKSGGGVNGNTVALPAVKKEAWDAYYRFSGEVAYGGADALAAALRAGIQERPLGVCCDFNGSARCVSIDKVFFEDAGIQFKAINARPGEIAHRIVPEGDSLEPCRNFLEETHHDDPAFVLGYVPDCDGDRGNLVIWDDTLRKARALEAQEVFALACAAELAQLAWTGELRSGKVASPQNVAVAVNDPTSLRIDRIAAAFGASVFRAEVGEANVVGLARKLRSEGYTVRILGEGSAGGNITHPSAVRDPLHTVLALAKLLSVRGVANNGVANNGGGLFELWCSASGQPERFRPDFTLADIIASLPPFVTTGAYSPEAVLKITSADHGALKGRYQAIFLREWEKRKNQLKTLCGIHTWQAAAYNGITEKKDLQDFSEAGKGGLKICFFDEDGTACASLWMRGSATEPVFRIIADTAGTNRDIERELIKWQRGMIIEADCTRARHEPGETDTLPKQPQADKG